MATATATLAVGTISLYVLHDIGMLAVDPAAEGIDVVVYGHWHRPQHELRGGVLFINPGSAGPLGDRQCLPRMRHSFLAASPVHVHRRQPEQRLATRAVVRASVRPWSRASASSSRRQPSSTSLKSQYVAVAAASRRPSCGSIGVRS
ncbi:MAG TPA: metallophosphoesterase family protein [Burkholderiaceae bacterium]|nr:metallophosphoesterase family protein [Burkholderiaceae bacterium]